MLFSQVIGQSNAKKQIQRLLREDRMPHALLLSGNEGVGKLPLALALAQRLLCQHPTPEGDACGQCAACRMAAKQAHPDLHFVYPVFKPTGQGSPAVSDQFLPQWRQQLSDTPYFTRQTWLARIGVENQQSLINVAEANNIVGKLSTASSQGGYRVILIWLAEQMNTECANKLLKILEEPPTRTIFILTTDHSERILDTILSRTQRIELPPLTEDELTHALVRQNGIDTATAHLVARAADGSYTNAVEQITASADAAQYLDQFKLFMRLCYMRKVRDLYEWANQLSAWGRERQKAFLEYSQRLIRENFIYNLHTPTLNRMSESETAFSVNFARFINERNVIGISHEIALAQRDVEQNVNPRMVLFDLALKTIVLLIQ